jgi:hypothetical protein
LFTNARKTKRARAKDKEDEMATSEDILRIKIKLIEI